MTTDRIEDAYRAVVDLRRRAGRRTVTPHQRALYLARTRGMVDAIALVTGMTRAAVIEAVEDRYVTATEA